MTGLVTARLLAACAGLVLLAAVQTASAQTKREPVMRFDSSGTRVVEMANLDDGEGCLPANEVGRVTKRHLEKGELSGITFKEGRYESYINVPNFFEIKNRETRRRYSEALSAMLVPGIDLKIKSFACGAAGRIVSLDAVALAKMPSVQAPAAPQPRDADPVPRFERGPSERVIAMSGLWRGAQCPASVVYGTIVGRSMNRGIPESITFDVERQQRITVQMPEVIHERDGALKANLIEAFASMIQPEFRLQLTVKTCADGAGRTTHLDGAALTSQSAAEPAPLRPATAAAPRRLDDADDRVLSQAPGSSRDAPMGVWVEERPQGRQAMAAARPASRPTRWKLFQVTTGQLEIRVSSADRAFGWSLSCTKDKTSGASVSNWFLGPRNWGADFASPDITIDGVRMTWKIGGADEGMVFSDSIGNDDFALSPKALAQLANGERFVVGGKTDRGRPRDAVFDISGGQAAFAEFDARCRRLPR